MDFRLLDRNASSTGWRCNVNRGPIGVYFLTGLAVVMLWVTDLWLFLVGFILFFSFLAIGIFTPTAEDCRKGR